MIPLPENKPMTIKRARLRYSNAIDAYRFARDRGFIGWLIKDRIEQVVIWAYILKRASHNKPEFVAIYRDAFYWAYKMGVRVPDETLSFWFKTYNGGLK